MRARTSDSETEPIVIDFGPKYRPAPLILTSDEETALAKFKGCLLAGAAGDALSVSDLANNLFVIWGIIDEHPVVADQKIGEVRSVCLILVGRSVFKQTGHLNGNAFPSRFISDFGPCCVCIRIRKKQ